MSIVTWRYYVPSLEDGTDSWSIVFIDSTGVVAVCSDYGDWCYRWVTRYTGSEDFRDFFVGRGSDYVASKLSSGRRDGEVFDEDTTRANVRREILTLRRDRTLSAEEARDEWDRSGGIDGELGFQDFLGDTDLADMYECAASCMAGGLKHWVTVSLPRLQQLIREQLATERQEPQSEATAL